jgi:SSS family solute:Na+ symporter
MGNFEWMAAFTLICLSLFFAPFYIRSGVATLPDFLEKRYSRGCRDWFAVISILSAIFIHMGFTLYTGAKVLEGFTGLPQLWCIVVVAGLTGLYTIIGGLLAVVLTESIQTLVLVGGAAFITAVGYFKVGGWDGLQSTLQAAQLPEHLTVLRGSHDASDLPWYTVFLGYPVLGLWYWCTDQTIVQRVLGAKDENHARVGPLFAGFIKILPVFIFVLPGAICLGLIRQDAMPGLPTTVVNGEAKPDTLAVYSHMIIHLLPVGLRGVVAAALLAALMSTVSGALNSIATLFSYDLVRRWRPETTDHNLVLIGRIVTAIAMVVAIAWSPLLAHYEDVFKGVNQMITYVAPPVTALFLWGVFWRRASSAAALATAWAGTAMGVGCFFFEWQGGFDWLADAHQIKIPFLMVAVYLFLACSAVLVVVSLIRPARHTPESAALVWNSPLDALRGKAWRGLGNYRLLAALLFVTMVVLYWIFA